MHKLTSMSHYVGCYLSSTAKQKTIQNVIDNLHISTLEYRNENDNDVSPYIHNRKLELIEVSLINGSPFYCHACVYHVF